MKALFRLTVVAAFAGAGLALLNHVVAVTFTPPPQVTPAAGSYVPGELLVKFKAAQSAQHLTSAIALQGHVLLADLNGRGWVHVKLGAGQTMDEALAAYRSNPDVEYVQPNYIYRAAVVPNDTQYGQLWAFRNTGQTIATGTYAPTSGTPGADINIERAWDHITDCSSIVVAVIDSGVNYNQADLAGNMWNGGPAFPNHGMDFVAGDNDPMDLNGHGTHVAGIIAAAGNNATGTTGVCWKASIMAVRVLDATGSGTSAGLLQGVNFAVGQGAKVINMSLSAAIPFDLALSNAISNAQANDVVVVVAAGNQASNNDGAGTARYPCNFTQPNLICVAALDQTYALANFSNWGATSVDVGAPGTNIVSTWNGIWSTISDDFHTGANLDWATSGGGWAYSQVMFFGSPVDALVNPASFPSGTYANSADNRVYKSFDLSSNGAAILNFFAQAAVQAGDALNVNFRSAGGDPFQSGVQLIGGSGNTGGFAPFSFDLSACLTATCSIGFQLLSNATGADQGAGVLFFSIDTLQLNNTSYETANGTSMATPMVTGLAAMLRAYNPQYTYVDAVNAIKTAGRPVAALNGRTTTGRAIDAMSSLAYLNPPAGLTATID